MSVLCPICFIFHFITLVFCRQGRSHMPCLLPRGRSCVTETSPRNSLHLNFLFSFFKRRRDIFPCPGLSPLEHRDSLNAECVQPPVPSFCMAGWGSPLFTEIPAPAALPPEHRLSKRSFKAHIIFYPCHCHRSLCAVSKASLLLLNPQT